MLRDDERGGVSIVPNPPLAGGQAEISVSNGADRIVWRIPPDGMEQEVDAPGGKATITIPAGTGGRLLSVHAGEDPDVVSDRFDIVETSSGTRRA